MKLSLAMIVKNEEEKLARCLESVKDYVDEMVIVDTGSTDRTKEIAESFGAKVYDFEWCKDFSKARNYSLEKATSEYVFVLDADEVVVDFPKEQIMNYLKDKKVLGLIEINNKAMRGGDETYFRSFFCSIFPRELRYRYPIHEEVEAIYPVVKLPISVFHDGYYKRDVSKYARNIEILENALKDEERPYYLYKLAQEYNAINLIERSNTLFSKAYKTVEKDKIFFPDLVIGYLKNLIKMKDFEKVLKVIKEEETRFSDFPEFHFVCGEFYTDLVLSNPQKYIQYFNKIEESYKRCISIGENKKYQTLVGMGTYLPMHNLAAFYEVTGNLEKAKEFYMKASELGFSKSKERLLALESK